MGQAYAAAYNTQLLLHDGVAREIASLVLPVGLFSSMYATCNAHSPTHFLGLRTSHPDAAAPAFPQREIEMVGEQTEAYWAPRRTT
ncbi:hypothetical protein GCM10010274_63400 [Streptomyces lavendofoliae]|uniref:Uncharacterized protein n=1 Tax=Streptomyces lavendofoliae TaxID=67314 RepID=A0A918M842_9ACTN|nr:hypothetical protein GCM10010274_63400 [Streptomyces lavendofoliae]